MTPAPQRVALHQGWQVAPRRSVFAQVRNPAPRTPVTLPHDAMLDQDRDPAAHGRTGYFPDELAVEYTRVLDVPEEWRDGTVALQLDGVYRDALVFVNDQLVTSHKGGYSPFAVELAPVLRYGRPNTVRVEARTHGDSRWYSGAGIIRDVFLLVTGQVHLARTGPVVTTPDVDDERAVVEVVSPVVSTARAAVTVTVDVELRDAAGAVVATGTSPLTIGPGERLAARHRLVVPAPRRWDPDDPHLYRARVTVLDGDGLLDDVSAPVGIRTLRLDPVHGLRVNDRPVELRGACVHHDNGVLGAATVARADERRVELLKAAGFNAIRSAHTPMSPAMLDACDRLGVLVVDEAFDVWTEGKTSFDGAADFPEWCERQVEAMVRKDQNHPSVVLYSIGNENVETGTPGGSAWGRRIADTVRRLDPTRFVTNGINPLVTLIRDVSDTVRRASDDRHAPAEEMPDGGVNELMDAAHSLDLVVQSDEVTRRTRESLAVLDVAGLNYGEARYQVELDLDPGRILVGTETAPRDIARNWAMVRSSPRLLGDFTWAGFDYLGEAGVGRVRFPDEHDTAFEAGYPWVAAWCADLDLTGYRRPQSYYREIVFGLRREPYLAVERPASRARGATQGQWSWLDAVGSWTWDVPEGTPMTVAVYAPHDEVELLADGVSLGRRPAGPAHGFTATFDVPYRPGTMTATGYDGGRPAECHTLRTAGSDLRLRVTADRTALVADHRALAFLELELVDGSGVLATATDRDVAVEVAGPAVLQGLGSARPDPDALRPFGGDRCRTFDGRALAVVRPTGPGDVTVTVRPAGLAAQSVHLAVVPGGAP